MRRVFGLCLPWLLFFGNLFMWWCLLDLAAGDARPQTIVCKGNRCVIVPAAPAAPTVAAPPKLLASPAIPQPPIVNPGGELPTGVAVEMLSRQDSFRRSGREVTRIEAIEAITGGNGNLTDDSGKFTLSIFCDDKRCREDLVARFRADPSCADVAARTKTWEASRGDWSAQAGFDTSSPHLVLFQAPDGAVLHAQQDLDGGLEAVVGAIRKAVQGYDAGKDPDLRRPLASPFKLLAGNNALALVCIAAVGFLLLRKDPQP